MSASGESSRLFVALPVPEVIRLRLNEAQAELRSRLGAGSASWPRSENFHLTLRFLGPVAKDRCEELKAALLGVAGEFPPLELAAERAGCFPNLRNPRVAWVSIRDAAGKLAQLHQRVNMVVAPFTDEPAEREFVPHVTLARLKHLRRPEADWVAEWIRRFAARRFGFWTATHLFLMESQLSSEGSRYHCLGELAFRGGDAPPA